jgi:hypothetical protein
LLLAAASLLAGNNLNAFAGDLAVVPLFDGERTGVLGTTQFLNNWGGPFLTNAGSAVARDTTVAHSGLASVRADLGVIDAARSATIQTYAGEVAASQLRQTRDVTRYDSVTGYFRNDTGAPLTIKYELKDYRNSSLHRAAYSLALPAGGGWTPLSVPLDLQAPGWIVDGQPDLSRTFISSLIVTPQSGAASGSIHIDDFAFHEAAGSLDPQTAPLSALAERLAERQFSGLWTARNRTTGLIYNTSDDAGVAALNTTAGVVQMLPSAIRRGWVSQADADAMVGQVAAALQFNLNQTTAGQARYVPTRFLNPSSGARPGGANEESSIDSSFLMLALHGYQSRPATPPALAAAIDDVVNRFRLDAFSNPAGFKLAYFPASGFTDGSYDGYTNEGKTISLAAEVSADHHVALATHWNKDVHRARVFLVNSADAHLTHSLSQFRAPFEQALLNLFVETSDRGVDSYPTRSLATNPWQNYVRYERETAAQLAQLGRDDLFQPDAGNGGTGGYQQYSMYNQFSQADLFMPWSVSLALLAGAPGAEDALRALLDEPLLNGPLGLADSARWQTGAAGPAKVPASQDNWNMALATMALLEYLDGGDSASQFFASLAEVDAALDTVFIPGDLTGDGVTSAADLSVWRPGFGLAAGATPASGDADGDGDVDGHDFLVWQCGLGSNVGTAANRAVPEPQGWAILAEGILLAILAGCRREKAGPIARPTPPQFKGRRQDYSIESACNCRFSPLQSLVTSRSGRVARSSRPVLTIVPSA